MREGLVVDERFEVLGLAGSGGMGSVYRARDRATGAHVALKVLRDVSATGTARLAREAQVLNELDHPDIVKCVACGVLESGAPYLAMEWCEGESLAARLARAPLGVGESLTLARRLAAALSAAHARGVVHRDLKPGNLFLVGGDVARPKVLDFGLAYLVEAERALTASGVVLGTPGYLAPEQARGARTIDARTDVFALGCVIFRCLAGRLPFEADHALGVLLKVVLEDAPRLSELRPEVTEALDDLVARMLAKVPANRPADAGEVLRELDLIQLVSERSPPSLRAGSPSLGRRERRVFCLLLVRDPAVHPHGSTGPEAARRRDDTLVMADLDALRAVGDVARQAGARFDALADGSLLLACTGSGDATDLAARTARAALATREKLPTASIVLATGRADVTDALPIGDVLDRAVRMSLDAGRCASRAGVVLDEVTAGLLAPRFAIAAGPSGPELVAEREIGEGVRTLLGRPAPFVGREYEVARLTSLYDECFEEPVARAAVLEGPAGIGKSRILFELLEALRRRRPAPVLWMARGDPMSAGAPLGLVSQLLRHAAGLRDGEPAALRREKLLARVSRHVAEPRRKRVAEFLGELTATPFPDEASTQLSAARRDAALMSDQVLQAWLDLVDAETSAGPLVIVLEDLHWGDRPTVRFVDAALAALRERPLLVLALARPEVQKAFPGLWDRAKHEERISELPRKASERLVRAALGDDVDAATVERLCAQAAGHAFYLEELVRAVADGRQGSMPGTVLAMLQTRLEGLDPDARRVLRAASIFGGTFWKGGVQALLAGVPAATVAYALEQLTAREMLTQRRESRFVDEEELAFRHPLVQEAAYAMLTEPDRVLGHRLAGDWLERVGEAEPLVLAEHFEKGAETRRAAFCYRRAVEASLGANDLDAAVARAERGAACATLLEGDGVDLMGTLRRLEAEARRWRGDLAPAEAVGLEAMRLLPPGSERWYEAAAEVALASGQLTHRSVLASVAEALRDTQPERGALDALVIAAAQAAFQMFFAGEDVYFHDLVALIESTAARLGTLPPAVSARVSEVRATAAFAAGDAGGYLELMAQVARDCEAAGDVRSLCWANINLGHAHLEVGAWAEAAPILRAALGSATHLGIREAIAAAHNNLGLALARLGALGEALDAEREAIERFQATGNRRLEGGSRIYLSLVHRLRGELPDAEREARAAAELLAAAPPLVPHALARLAEAMLAAGRVDDALATALRATAEAKALGRLEEGEAALALVEAEALHASGRVDDARAAIAAARTRVLERAAKIASAARRRTFLEGVPEHARTLDLANRWPAG